MPGSHAKVRMFRTSSSTWWSLFTKMQLESDWRFPFLKSSSMRIRPWSLAGAFEHFVRRVVRDGILAISGKGVNYDTLDDGIKKQNVYRTGIAFGTIHEPPDYLEL